MNRQDLAKEVSEFILNVLELDDDSEVDLDAAGAAVQEFIATLEEDEDDEDAKDEGAGTDTGDGTDTSGDASKE